MQPQQRALIAINLIGGPAVLASYAWGFLAHPEAMTALWGGVPESARGLYTVNMFLAAFGYLLFTPYFVFRWLTAPQEARFGTWVSSFYVAILIPSALWLPLTFWMVEDPSTLLWVSIRVVLTSTAIGSAGLLGLLLFADVRLKGHTFAILGLLPFCLQTVVLDAIVWPLYFSTN